MRKFREFLGKFSRREPTYEFRDNTLIYTSARGVVETLEIDELLQWISDDEVWNYWVTLKTKPGLTLQWHDPKCELERLLSAVAPEKMIRLTH